MTPKEETQAEKQSRWKSAKDASDAQKKAQDASWLKREKDSTWKNIISTEKAQEQLELKTKIKQIALEGGVAKAQPYWEEVDRKVAELTASKGQANIAEYATLMMELFGGYRALASAMIYDEQGRKNALNLAWNISTAVPRALWNKTIGATKVGEKLETAANFTAALGSAAASGLASLPGKLSDKALKKVGLRPDEKPPEIVYTLRLDEQTNALSAYVIRDGKPLPAVEQQLFDIGFLAWAKTKHYEIDSKTQTLKATATHPTAPLGEVMTQAKLTELNQGDKGLKDFFKKTCDLAVKASPNSPRPS